MNNIIEAFTTGQFRFLVWFIAAILFIYIPFMYLWLKRRKDKAQAYEHENPQFVKIYIQRTELNDILTVVSINDAKPVMFAKGIQYGFYALPGKNVIYVTYQWITRSMTALTGYETHTVDDEEMQVNIEAGKEYKLGYNHKSQKYELTER